MFNIFKWFYDSPNAEVDNPIKKEIIECFTILNSEFKEYIPKDWHLDIKNVQINEDGLVIYKGDVYLAGRKFKELPKAFKYIKQIHGALNIVDCKNLENVDNFLNLRYVKGYIGLSRCKSLKNVYGFRNLKYVHQLDFWGCDFLGSLQPLINLDVSKIVYFNPPERREELLNLQYATKEFEFADTIQKALNV